MSIRHVVVSILLAASMRPAHSAAPAAVKAFIENYCADCHNDDDLKADLDLTALTFEPGDEFIFCSDGLTTMLSDEEIHDMAGEEPTPQDLCRKLVDTANERGGVDNITVVVVKLPKSSGRASGSTPAVA